MTIGKKMGLGFGVLLALSVTLAVVVLFNVSDMHRQFSFVIEHDAPVIANARHLSKLVVDMETGQRGFVITGQDEFLEPYDNALASFADLLDAEDSSGVRPIYRSRRFQRGKTNLQIQKIPAG